MSIPVLSVHRDDDGVWRPLGPPAFTSREVDTVDSLESFVPEEAPVDTGEQVRRLTVYRYQDRKGWVLLAEA